MLFVDLTRLLWLLALIGMIAWVPAAVAARSRRPPIDNVVEQAALSTIVIFVAVSILGPLSLLNPFTLLLAGACWPAARLLFGRRLLPREAISPGRSLLLRVVSTIERADYRAFRARLSAVPRLHFPRRIEAGTSAQSLLIALLVVAAVAPRLALSISNTRLPDISAYAELLTTQQLLAGDAPWAHTSVFATISAALSLAGSMAPIHVVRLLSPILAGAVLLALMLLVSRMAGMAAAIIAVLTAALIPIAHGPLPNHEIGTALALVAFWLMSLALTGSRGKQWPIAGCVVLVAITAPLLLVIVALAAACLLLRPSWTLVVTGGGLIVFSYLAGDARDLDQRALVNLPVGAGMIAGGVVQLVARALKSAHLATHTTWLTSAGVVVLLLAPRTTSAHFVEYDQSASNTVAIANAFPKYRFMIVGPVEQWVLSYGRGWHMDLHAFVAAASDLSGAAPHRLATAVDDLFIFVEPQPFRTSSAEPAQVPFQVLTDPVFRQYRSQAGRASLQFAAYEICERYRRDGTAQIHYDDGRLRIYRIRVR